MHRIKVEEGVMSVTLQPRWGGGVVDAELTSHYACPKCGETLRFMALFKTSDDCLTAFENLELGYTVKAEAIGRFIVATTGDKAHGRRSSYHSYGSGSVCSRIPFLGTERELVRTIWARFHQQYGPIDWSKVKPMPRTGRVDITRLDNVEWVDDQVNPNNRPLLVIDSGYLNNPTEMIVGGWDSRKEDYRAWNKRREKASEAFLKRISLASKNY